MIIYKIYNDVNSKLYIGQTTKSLEERINGHHASMIGGQDTHLYRAMRKYGWDKFHFEIVSRANSQDELNYLEEYYIRELDTIRNGYNMAPGGSKNVMYSPIVAAKHDAKMRTDSVRKKISESMKKSYASRGGPSEEHRKHLSQAKKEYYKTPESELTREKFRKSFNLSPEHYKALNDSKNKSVYCINESNEVVARFDRVKDAAIWWMSTGYKVKHYDQLCDKIKESSKQDRFIRGLKWFYCV